MAGDGEPRRDRRGRRLRAMAVGAGLLLALEILLRVLPWGPPSREEFNRRHNLVTVEHYYELRDAYIAEFDPGDGTRVCGPLPDLAPDPDGTRNTMQWDRFPCDKPGGSLRILTLGGSSTAGWGVEADASFPRVLEAQLTGVSSGPVEVINVGVAGHTTVQIRAMLPSLRFLDADVLVLYAGHNDYNFFQVADAAELTPRWIRTVRGAGDRLALWRLVRGAYYRVHPPVGGGPVPQLGGTVGTGRPPPAHPGPRATPDDRADRLALIADEQRNRDLIEARFHESVLILSREARSRDAALVLVAPVSRIDDGPLDSIHWTDLDDGELARWSDAYARIGGPGPGEPPGRQEEQERLLGEAMAIDDSYAQLRYLAGRRALAAGDLRAARDHFAASMDHVPPGRCDRAPPGHRRIVEASAAEVDAVFVDPWPAFEAAAEVDGLPGRDLFIDSLHPAPAGHALLAGEIAAALQEQGLVPTE